MPNKSAKDKKRKRRLLNLKLNQRGRTALQVKKWKKKNKDTKQVHDYI